MERFLNGTDQENSKPQGGKGQIRKVQKNKKERVEEKKQEIDYVHGGSHILCVLHQSGTPLGSHPHATLLQANPLLWEPPLQHNTYQLFHFIL
jgi:hypothetical protein